MDVSRPPTEIDERLLEVFCSNVAVGLDNVELVSHLHNAAFYDQLSKLPNRTRLIEILDATLTGPIARRCWSTGIRARAAPTSARSISTNATPTCSPMSSSISPQGLITSEWPYVRRPSACVPLWAAAITKEAASMARARISTCQCA